MKQLIVPGVWTKETESQFLEDVDGGVVLNRDLGYIKFWNVDDLELAGSGSVDWRELSNATDKLDRAIVALRKSGAIIVRGVSKEADRYELYEMGGEVVFWGMAEDRRWLRDRHMFLEWSGNEGFVDRVVKTLRDFGLDVDWYGNPNDCIRVSY